MSTAPPDGFSRPEWEKWCFLRRAPYTDAEHPRIRELARLLREAADEHPVRYAQLCHTVARDWIRQQTDTARVGGEDVAGFTRASEPDDAVEALRRGVDDCDAKARLFCALCLAGGLSARMVPYWSKQKPAALDHVAAEVAVGGRWQPVELTLQRARLGERGEAVPKEQDGKWLESQ